MVIFIVRISTRLFRGLAVHVSELARTDPSEVHSGRWLLAHTCVQHRNHLPISFSLLLTKTSTFSCQIIYKWQFVCLHLTGVQTKTPALAARPRSLNLCKMLSLGVLENCLATAKASIFTNSKESSPSDCLVYFSTAPPLDNKLGIVGIPSLYSNRAKTCLSLPACCLTPLLLSRQDCSD